MLLLQQTLSYNFLLLLLLSKLFDYNQIHLAHAHIKQLTYTLISKQNNKTTIIKEHKTINETRNLSWFWS